MIIKRCTLCGHPGIIHQENPIGTIPNYTNRCSGKALSGKTNKGSGKCKYTLKDSWRGASVNPSSLCGFPLIGPDSRTINSLPLEELVNFTHSEFSVTDLIKKIASHNNIDLAYFQ